MRRVRWAVLVAVLAACDSGTEPPEQVTFVVEVGSEQFKVRAEGAAIVALEARRQAGTTGVISGKVMRGNGGFNAPWGWHLDPATVHAPDLAMELCDGNPSYIDEDLDYWVDTVKQYCPWGARVVAVDSN